MIADHQPLVQDTGAPAKDLTFGEKKLSSLVVSHPGNNQQALARLLEEFKAKARALGADVKLADFEDF